MNSYSLNASKYVTVWKGWISVIYSVVLPQPYEGGDLLVSEATTRNLGRCPAVWFNLLRNYCYHSLLRFEWFCAVLRINILENPPTEIRVENDDKIGREPQCTEHNLLTSYPRWRPCFPNIGRIDSGWERGWRKRRDACWSWLLGSENDVGRSHCDWGALCAGQTAGLLDAISGIMLINLVKDSVLQCFCHTCRAPLPLAGKCCRREATWGTGWSLAVPNFVSQQIIGFLEQWQF